MNHAETGKVDVALVQMPFAATSWPSLGLGLLKSALTRAGVGSQVIYLNSVFADRVGEELYQYLSDGLPDNTDLLGEWVFSRALWGDDALPDQSFFDTVMKGRHAAQRKHPSKDEVGQAWRRAGLCREQVEAYLESCIASYDWQNYRVVGFTSVFQQHVAALALAKRLKARFPHLNIVFGGANCEGPMGLATLRAFDFIDAVCIGEGDTAFPAYVGELIEGRRHGPTNVVTREQLGALDPAADGAVAVLEKTVEMDDLPYPDFDEFFAQSRDRRADGANPLRIIFETSRGCWWGQKNHCTFCGLNGTTMAFRYKSPRRAIEEIQHLLERYGEYTQQLSAADNIIPYKYFDEFLPELIRLDMKLSLFYETKSNLRKEQLVAYRDAGMREIQPGIESLDTDILRLMRKGVSGIQNVQLLKWCKELGIVPIWNYLYGFPGEDPSSYDHMAENLEALIHLDPPFGSGQLRFDRFSPYVSSPETFGIKNLQPYPAYEYLYPGVPAETRFDMAYYFTGEYAGHESIPGYTEQIRESVRRWRQKAPDSMLAHIDDGEGILVFDIRGEEAVKIISLRGLYRKVVAQSDGIVTAAQLDLSCAERGQLPLVLADLKERGLVFVEGERFIRLSVPLGSDYQPPPDAMNRLQDLLIKQNRRAEDDEMLKINQDNIVTLEI